MNMLRQTIARLCTASTGLFHLDRSLVIVAGLGMGPVLAQPPTVPASPALQARITEFEGRIAELARTKADEPALRRLSPQQRQGRVEFVIGNIFFVALHELGHAVVSELKVPVLGREEDTADVFAIGAALRIIANEFAHRILVGAASGWFLSARRAKKEGEAPRYYERHGLDKQRAYHIVCLMVGHDPVRFKDLADEHKLPEDRRQSCGWDYETGAWSWHRVMAPHLRAAGQPKTSIEVIYGDAEGTLAPFAHAFREVRFLELLAEYAASRYLWPAPIVMEMRSCGNASARWTIPTRRLHICYELAQEFAELFGDLEQPRKSAGRRRDPLRAR
jgi:hypothetical protein